ncbi:hypothetical protein RGQ15_16760 [Paracoccus sp. MBLB3053]|uniref:DUF3618 domain-containing protein n=1 Tax=Paracoccus aurantius TaxID=3073814 RepID=A0ABU2HVY6_9RHOB|nr:hypothetical protein [Paracoccus sp. MBLB3053]MDS9469214.1 hypothetical protein [Paracoccus sp. MBLB3053]
MSGDELDATDPLHAEVKRLADALDDALEKVEKSEEGADWKRRSRLLRLEAQYLLSNQPKPRTQPKSRGQRLWSGITGAFSALFGFLLRLAPVLPPLVVAAFGFMLTGTTREFLELRKVELEEQKLDLATIQAIDDHLEKLRASNIGQDEADQIASRIAYFGTRAIVPLVAELRTIRTEVDPRAKAIAGALEVSALYPGQRDRICAILKEAGSESMRGVLSEAGQKVGSQIFARIGCDG